MEEAKFFQTFGASTQVLTGAPIMGAMIPLITQGTSAITRLGSVISMYNIKFRAMIACNVAAASVIRVLIIRDKQPNGALPASAQIFFADKTAANSWYSGYDPTFVGPRFEVLMDRSKQLAIQGGATDQGEKTIMKWRSKKPIKAVFNGNAGTIADIVKNDLLLCCYTDVAANGPFITFECTYNFKDA